MPKVNYYDRLYEHQYFLRSRRLRFKRFKIWKHEQERFLFSEWQYSLIFLS